MIRLCHSLGYDAVITDLISSELIGLIYDAAVSAVPWEAAIAAIREVVGGEVAALFKRDSTVAIQYCEFSAACGWTMAALDHYGVRREAQDTRAVPIARLRSGDTNADDHGMVSYDAENSDIFQAFLRQFELGQGMAASLFQDGQRQSVLSVHRSVGGGSFTAEDITRFKTITPHIVRALQIQRQMHQAQIAADGLRVTLDHFHLSVFMTDAEARVRLANAAADTLLSRSGSMLRIANGRLTLADKAENAELWLQIRNAAAVTTGAVKEVGSPPRILSSPDRNGIGRMAFLVVPVRNTTPLGISEDGLIAIFVSDTTASPTLDLAALQQEFGLTQAEAEVAAALTTGHQLHHVATSRRVSVETARTLLKRAFIKTDTNSQAQLVALITRSLSALRRPR